MPDTSRPVRRRVPLEQIAVVGEPDRAGRVVVAPRRGSLVGPVHAQVADVGERVAERAQLPVEDGRDAAVLDVGHAVAEAEVAVGDDDALAAAGTRVGQPSGHLVDRGKLAGLRVRPLRRPALELALDVPLASGEVAEADLVDVERVQVGEHVDEVLARRPTELDRDERDALSGESSTTPSTNPIT